jgi:hypothetical protein
MLQFSKRMPVNGGYTHAERFRSVLPGGTPVFVKRAVDQETADWLRTEARLYKSLAGASFLARCIAFEEGPKPTLVLEDLAHGHWPGKWRPGDVERVLSALDALHDTPAPSWVPPAGPQDCAGWALVAENPATFLSLGLASESWLDQHLEALLSLEQGWPGPMVLSHKDIRSDNLCILPDRVVIVDWNWVCLAPRALDAAFWSPSLSLEGGPAPEELVGTSAVWAARVSGFFAARAGLPRISHAPRVREIQLAQLKHSLPWLNRALARG